LKHNLNYVYKYTETQQRTVIEVRQSRYLTGYK